MWASQNCDYCRLIMVPTPKHLLADLLLDEPLLDWLEARRPKTSWRRLSLELRDATGGKVDVTPESLRAWYVTAGRTDEPATGTPA